jgi:hypothetical protein
VILTSACRAWDGSPDGRGRPAGQLLLDRGLLYGLLYRWHGAVHCEAVVRGLQLGDRVLPVVLGELDAGCLQGLVVGRLVSLAHVSS